MSKTNDHERSAPQKPLVLRSEIYSIDANKSVLEVGFVLCSIFRCVSCQVCSFQMCIARRSYVKES